MDLLETKCWPYRLKKTHKLLFASEIVLGAVDIYLPTLQVPYLIQNSWYTGSVLLAKGELDSTRFK